MLRSHRRLGQGMDRIATIGGEQEGGGGRGLQGAYQHLLLSDSLPFWSPTVSQRAWILISDNWMRDKKNFLRYWVNLVLTQRLCVTKTLQSHRAYETQNFCQKTHKWYFSVLYWWTEWCWVTRRLQNTALPWFICSLSTCRACIASKALSKVELISVGRLWLEVTHSDPLTAALWLCRQRDWDNRHHLCEVAQIVAPNDQENMNKSGEVTRC